MRTKRRLALPPSTCLNPVDVATRKIEVVRSDAVDGCHGGLGVQIAQCLQNMGDAFTPARVDKACW